MRPVIRRWASPGATSRLCSALLLAALCSPAMAGTPHGLVIRVDLKSADNVAGDVVVHLKGESGTKDVKVGDDGTSPDVTAGDQVYSGTTWLDADAFEVTLSVGATSYTGGKVSWDPANSARDLAISVDGKTMTAEAAQSSKPAGPTPTGDGTAGGAPPAVAGQAAAPTGAGAALTAPDGSVPPGTNGVAPGAAMGGGGTAGQPPSGGGTPPGGDGSAMGQPPAGATSPGGPPPIGAGAAPGGSPAAMSPAGATAISPMLYVGFGAGLLLVTWLIYSSMRGGRGGGDELIPLAEPGLLGPTTPSLSGGAAIWKAEGADANALADALVTTLARHHRVIVATSVGYTPAMAFGGPVYKLDVITPKAIGKLLDALDDEGGLPVAILIRGPADAASLAKLVKELPEEVGPFVVTDDVGETSLPVVQCRRDGEVWRFITPAGEVRARPGADGLTAA